MIITRYLARHIFQGAALVLFILVCLSLFFTLIRELDDVGRGQYGMAQVLQYLALRAPSFIVEYMPLAALLGCILSLGSLASNSELIALQSSGLSLKKFVTSVGISVLVLALLSLLIADLLVPISETRAKQLRSSNMAANISKHSRSGVWIKDENNIVFIERLYPDGNAKNIEIYQLNDQGRLWRSSHAGQATIQGDSWVFQNIKTSEIKDDKVQVSVKDQISYTGSLTQSLLESLAIDSQQMALTDLFTYMNFLKQNNLDYQSASLSFWRKLYAPLSIVVMGLLAIPFVLGSQRHKNTGQRIMLGILLGLLYVVLNRLLIQLGEQLHLVAYINALLPTFIFLLITIWLIRRKTRAV